VDVTPKLRVEIADALPKRDRTHWYLAADTAAEIRPYILPAAGGGPIGRQVAQINDVAMHLGVIVPLVPVLYGKPPYDWLIRSALVNELSALLDLTIGPPRNVPRYRAPGASASRSAATH